MANIGQNIQVEIRDGKRSSRLTSPTVAARPVQVSQ